MGKKKKKKITQLSDQPAVPIDDASEKTEEKVEKWEVIKALTIIGTIVIGFVVITVIDARNGFLTDLSSWLMDRFNVLF